MRKFISGLLAIAAAAFTGCYESGTDADNTSREARISISPAAIGFDADGRTTDGLAFGTYIVTVNPYGKMYSDWHAELVGTDWATLDYQRPRPTARSKRRCGSPAPRTRTISARERCA